MFGHQRAHGPERNDTGGLGKALYQDRRTDFVDFFTSSHFIELGERRE